MSINGNLFTDGDTICRAMRLSMNLLWPTKKTVGRTMFGSRHNNGYWSRVVVIIKNASFCFQWCFFMRLVMVLMPILIPMYKLQHKWQPWYWNRYCREKCDVHLTVCSRWYFRHDWCQSVTAEWLSDVANSSKDAGSITSKPWCIPMVNRRGVLFLQTMVMIVCTTRWCWCQLR